jgi:hypothetical protein
VSEGGSKPDVGETGNIDRGEMRNGVTAARNSTDRAQEKQADRIDFDMGDYEGVDNKTAQQVA